MTSFSSSLLVRISEGDREAFRLFYDEVYPIAYKFTRYFLSNKQDCEEVVSEVFFIIWKNRTTLTEVRCIKAWLYTVCRNEVYSYLKKEKKYQLSIDEMQVELFIDKANIEADIISDEMLTIYNKALAELPPRCKLIFQMIREEGLKHKEVAHILSISEGTVEQQMNIGIRKITASVIKHYPSLNVKKT